MKQKTEVRQYLKCRVVKELGMSITQARTVYSDGSELIVQTATAITPNFTFKRAATSEVQA